MTTEVQRLNQVDLEAVGALASACIEDREKAQTRWSASVVWKKGFASEARVREHQPIPSDEPLTLGGTDTAPNPVEQLLGALGNCLAVGYAANASAAGIELRDLRIELEGDLDLSTFLGIEPGHAGYRDIRVRVHLESDADPGQIRAIHEKVVSTSPVGHTLTRPIPVEVVLA